MKALPLTAPPASQEDSAGRQLEAFVLRQLLEGTGTFKSLDSMGGGVFSGLVAEAMADAVVQGGGIGLATLIDGSKGASATPAPTPAAPPVSLAAANALAEQVVAGAHASSRFGARRDPFTAEQRLHKGLDVAAPEGAPIRALDDGVVVAAGERGGFGLCVEILHGDGRTTLYAHARKLNVSEGQRISSGEQIGEVGSTGRSTGPHVHLEVRERGVAVDPVGALKIYRRRSEDEGGGPSHRGPRHEDP